MRRGPLLAALLTGCLAATAHAHGRSASHSSWVFTAEGATVSLRLALLDVSAAPLPAAGAAVDDFALPALLEYAQRHLALATPSGPCTPGGALASGRSGSDVYLEWRVACPPGPRSVTSHLFDGSLAGHLHFARVRVAGQIHERVLDERQPTALVPETDADETWHAVTARHVRLGVGHILTGTDHLLFLALLLAGAASLRRLAWLATAFTVGHSATLALAATGLVTPNTAAVEALIGASIAWVAVDNAYNRNPKGPRTLAVAAVIAFALIGAVAAAVGAPTWQPLFGIALFAACQTALVARHGAEGSRWLLVMCFGLIHGFGFAGFLLEAEVPAATRAGALLGFNLGVELAQLAVLATLWGVLHLLRRAALETAARASFAAAGAGAGVFWVVTRSFA